ncbi:MAG: YhcH/YjgK/YiaL family protein [Elusimicrobia bacterium]|jgi:YhcH/YjgK/YiaL family protein|nr:YhcH/YjgK/YiaL family protein [Elusimicrobiota bacterium]
MLVSSTKKYKKILNFFPQLEIVFDYINKNIDAETLDGKYNITKEIFATVQTCQPKPKDEQVLEKHKKYIDLQYVISGKEKIGWKFFDKSFKVLKRYNVKKDISFYSNPPDTFINLKKGEFAVFFPEDTHAPLCCDKEVKKCIVKIPVKYLSK